MLDELYYTLSIYVYNIYAWIKIHIYECIYMYIIYMNIIYMYIIYMYIWIHIYVETVFKT